MSAFVQTQVFKSNPFSWAPTPDTVSTGVVRFDLRTAGEGTLVSVTDLPEPLDIFIPVDPLTHVTSSRDAVNHVVVSRNKMTVLEILSGDVSTSCTGGDDSRLSGTGNIRVHIRKNDTISSAGTL